MFASATASAATASASLPGRSSGSNNSSSKGDNKNDNTYDINLFDHLVLYRFYLDEDEDEDEINHNSDDDSSYVWWPALLFDSHVAALPRFAQNPANILLEHRRFCLNLLKEQNEPAISVVELLGFPEVRLIHLPQPQPQPQPQAHAGQAQAQQAAAAVNNTATTTSTAAASSSTTTATTPAKRDTCILPLTITAAAVLRKQNAKQHAAAFEQAIQDVSKILSGSPPPKKKTMTTAAASASATVTVTATTTCTHPEGQNKESSTDEHQPQESDNHGSFDDNDNDGDQVMQQDDDDDNNNNNVDLEDPGILPNDSWEAVWYKLQCTGWVQYRDPASRRDLYSMPPAFDHLYDQPSYTLEELQDFCQAKYHWQPPLAQRHRQQLRYAHHDGRSVVSTSNTTLTTVDTSTPNRRTQPQDPGAPLFSSSSSDESSVASNPYEIDYLWHRRLAKEGWKMVKASNPLHDWYYCKPGINKHNGVLGINMFPTQNEVIRHVQALDGYQPSETEDEPSPTGPRRKRGRDVARRLSLDSVATHTNKKKKRSQSEQRQQLERRERTRSKSTERKQSQKQRDSSSLSLTRKRSNSKTTVDRSKPRSTAKKASQKPVVTTQKKKSKKNVVKKQDWWKIEPIPTAADVQPILEKLGVQRNDDGTYILPFQDLPFDSSRGLGILFLQAGIPNLSKLTKTETTHLLQWARFVNVPSTATPNVLKQLKLPVNAHELYDMLRVLGFQIALEYIYLPNSTADRKLNVHYFLRSDWNTKFRQFLQTSWCLESPQADEQKDQQEDPYNNGWTAEQQELALTLRLWGALYDDKPIVSLQELPKPSRRGGGGVDLSKLQHLAELPSVTLDFVENQDKNEEDESSQDSAVQELESSSASDNTNNVCLVTPMPQRKPKKDLRPWYNKTPDFSEVWPILKNKMGWTQTSSGRYEHPFVPNRSFAEPMDVRRFVATTAIPHIERGAFSDNEKRILNRWAMTVNVDEYFGSKGLCETKKINQNQLFHILYALGFSSANGNLYLIHADRCRETRKPFTLESLLVYLLTHDNWSGDPERPFAPQDYLTKITESKMMQVIQFALEMVKPSLPIFRTPEKPKTKSRRRASSPTEPATSTDPAKSKREASAASNMESGNGDSDETGLTQGQQTAQLEVEPNEVASGTPTQLEHEEAEQSSAVESLDPQNDQNDNSQSHVSSEKCKDEVAECQGGVPTSNDDGEMELEPQHIVDVGPAERNEQETEEETSPTSDDRGMELELQHGDDVGPGERNEQEAEEGTLQHGDDVGSGERNELEAEEETETFEVEEYRHENDEHAPLPLLTQAQETLSSCCEGEDSVYFPALQEATAEDSHQHHYVDETFQGLDDSLSETYQMIEDMDKRDYQPGFLTQDP